MENKKAYLKYSSYLLLSLFTTLVGTIIGQFLNPESIKMFAILSFVLIFAFLFSKGTLKKILFFVFCLGGGILLTPILYYYTKASIIWCLVLTIAITMVFLFIGMKAKNLGFLGGFLFIGLLSLLLYTILSIFIPLPALSLIGVVLFCGYISYDINCFKREANDSMRDEDILEHVMNMYLDILNLLLYILKLFGNDD